MGQFIGFVEQESVMPVSALVCYIGRPVEADVLPTFRVYGPQGLMQSGTGTLAQEDSGAVGGASNTPPIVISSPSHGLTSGTLVTVAGVGGNTAANGTWTITRVDGNNFSLNGSTGNGVFTSGGTWHVTGLYNTAVAAAAANGYIAGETYNVLVSALSSGIPWAELYTFTVT